MKSISSTATRLSRMTTTALAAVITLGLVAGPAGADTGSGQGSGTATGTETAASAVSGDLLGRAAIVVRLEPGRSASELAAEASDKTGLHVQAMAVIESRNVYEFSAVAEQGDTKKSAEKNIEDLAEVLEESDDTVWIASESDTTASATRFHAWPVDQTWDELAVSTTVDDAFDLGAVHSVARGKGAIVAVLDSGFDVSHPALVDHMMSGFDLIDDDTDVADELDYIDNDGDGQTDEGYGHGTFVSGLVLKIAPDASILPIRVLDSDGSGRSHAITEGIHLAIEEGADVINLSFGMTAGKEPKELDKALRRARSSGVVVVVAAGNTDENDPKLIGRDQKVISVAASAGPDGVLANFSSYGKKVMVSAPGIDVVSAVPGGGFATWSGSSMAAPIVAGQAALLMALAPGSSTSEDGDVRDWIKKSSVEPSKKAGKRKTKHGLVDIEASIDRLIDDLDL